MKKGKFAMGNCNWSLLAVEASSKVALYGIQSPYEWKELVRTKTPCLDCINHTLNPPTHTHAVEFLFLLPGALNKQLVVTRKLYDEKKLS